MPLIDDILREAGFSSSALADVKAGKVHQGGSLEAASDKELSVKLAFHVHAKLSTSNHIFIEMPKKKEYDRAVEALEMIAGDGGEGSLEDFKDLKLSNAKVMDTLYRKAAPGSDLNLAKDEIALFNKCKTHEEVEECLRQVLLDRFRAYKESGLAGIKPYARSREEFSPGDELRAQMEAGKILPKYSPTFNKFAMDYPKNKPEGMTESFFWVNSIIDNKPSIALVHRVGMPQSGGSVFMERQFYISRGHNCLQASGFALPYKDHLGKHGYAVVYASRTSTDRVSGFGGATRRTVGNKLMGWRMAKHFERAQNALAEEAASIEIGRMHESLRAL